MLCAKIAEPKVVSHCMAPAGSGSQLAWSLQHAAARTSQCPHTTALARACVQHASKASDVAKIKQVVANLTDELAEKTALKAEEDGKAETLEQKAVVLAQSLRKLVQVCSGCLCCSPKGAVMC